VLIVDPEAPVFALGSAARFAAFRLSPDLEVGAAAAIDVESGRVVAPGPSFDAGRAAPLADQANSSAVALAAVVAFFIAGFAIEDLDVAATAAVIVPAPVIVAIPISTPVTIAVTIAVTVSVAAVTAEFELGAATAIDPDSPPVIAPGAAFGAGRTASLANQPNAAASVGLAIVELPVIRRAIDGLGDIADGAGSFASGWSRRQSFWSSSKPFHPNLAAGLPERLTMGGHRKEVAGHDNYHGPDSQFERAHQAGSPLLALYQFHDLHSIL
jgi:hypothetical protein